MKRGCWIKYGVDKDRHSVCLVDFDGVLEAQSLLAHSHRAAAASWRHVPLGLPSKCAWGRGQVVHLSPFEPIAAALARDFCSSSLSIKVRNGRIAFLREHSVCEFCRVWWRNGLGCGSSFHSQSSGVSLSQYIFAPFCIQSKCESESESSAKPFKPASPCWGRVTRRKCAHTRKSAQMLLSQRFETWHVRAYPIASLPNSMLLEMR